METRDAKASDAHGLILLLSQIWYDLNIEKIEARIKAFNSKHHRLVVTEEANQVIAFGCYEQLRLTGSCCHIDTLMVDANHRGWGLGKQLVVLAEHYASTHGAKTIELISANHRKKDGTHAFYQSLAYQNHIALDCAYFAKENLS